MGLAGFGGFAELGVVGFGVISLHVVSLHVPSLHRADEGMVETVCGHGHEKRAKELGQQLHGLWQIVEERKFAEKGESD